MIKEVTAISNGDRSTIIKVKINVTVNSDGLFTTTLSKEDAELIESYGVELKPNRTGRAGFFKSDTMADLIDQVHKVLKLCIEYKVVSLSPVIRYNFKTACNYIMNGDEPVPNGYYLENYTGLEWKRGTVDNEGFTSTGCYGVNIYAKPYMKRVVEYGNGKQKIFYDRGGFEKDTYMGILESFGGMNVSLQNHLYEMEGTEKNAKFFVDMIKSICIFNEKLKGLLENDMLESLINSQARLDFMGNS